MSGHGWELVGKGNKKSNVPAKKLTKTEKKKLADNLPQIEDILPYDQIRSLYSTLDNKENYKPQKNGINKANEVKKEKPKKKASEKKKEPVKTVPKSLDAAVKLLDLQELVSVAELHQTQFPTVPWFWLRCLSDYLNPRLTHSGTTALPKVRDSPLLFLPKNMREVLQKVIKQAGDAAVQYYFDFSLVAIANNISKGNLSNNGYKVMLQLCALQSSRMLMDNLDFKKVHSLCKSYQNKQAIGLEILWGIGQLGIRDTSIGLSVWNEFMLPMLEMRNYSGFVINYFEEIVSLNQHAKSSLGLHKLMSTLDTVVSCSSEFNLSNNIREDLFQAANKLVRQSIVFDPESKSHLLFRPFLLRLTMTTEKSYREELLTSLVFFLKSDKESFNVWQEMFQIHPDSSEMLLDFLKKNGEWKNMDSKLLQDTFLSFQVTHQKLLKGKSSDDSYGRCVKVCESLKQTMTVTSSFPWRFGSFLILLAITGLVAFDIQRHGSFKSSSTGLFLRDVGALKYSELAWVQTKQYSSTGYIWAQENLPVYYQEASTRIKPYLHQAKVSAGVVGTHLNQTYWNVVAYVQEKAPLVQAWVNHYAPGLTEAIQKQAFNLWDLIKNYSFLLVEFLFKQSNNAFIWAKTNIFVGNLSPEKLQQYSQEAINTTQVYAAWTYDWVREKVHTFSKVQ